MDAGQEDQGVLQRHGFTALRRARLQRLLDKALAQGAVASQGDLAQALRVSVCTVKRACTALHRGHLSAAVCAATEYGLLGSRRVLELLTRDLEALAEQFYPPAERVPSGWMVFTGTRATGTKARPGQTTAAYEPVTPAWPVLLPGDLEQQATLPSGSEGQRCARHGSSDGRFG